MARENVFPNSKVVVIPLGMVKGMEVPGPVDLRIEGDHPMATYGDDKTGMIRTVPYGKPITLIKVKTVVRESLYDAMADLGVYLDSAMSKRRYFAVECDIYEGLKIKFTAVQVDMINRTALEPFIKGCTRDRGPDADGFPVHRDISENQMEYEFVLKTKEPATLEYAEGE